MVQQQARLQQGASRLVPTGTRLSKLTASRRAKFEGGLTFGQYAEPLHARGQEGNLYGYCLTRCGEERTKRSDTSYAPRDLVSV